MVEKYASAEPSIVAGFEVPTSWKRLQDFKTGAAYQMYHALGMIAVGLLWGTGRSGALRVAGWSFLFGIVLFSGSLYVLCLTGETNWGMVAPIGGLSFIVGWGALAFATCACCCGPSGTSAASAIGSDGV
jgi:uncharacterized membrane protein YgdD (TMEM256/DUF423 family)